MSKRSGRLPTLWFEKRRIEKSFMTPRTRRVKELIDVSQHTQIKEVNPRGNLQMVYGVSSRSKKCHHEANKPRKKSFESIVV